MAHLSFHQNRILGRNSNGTIAMTTQPSNESELQLYRVLQRANLLAYYDTFICQGGDDVQQLCEAGEEEFLEIMALVGMASKPLHVRRLQKALQEWMSNPAMFQAPIISPFPGSGLPAASSRLPICSMSANAQNQGSARGSTHANGNVTNHNSSASANSNQTTATNRSSPTNLMQPTFTGNMSTPSPSHFQGSIAMGDYSQPCSPGSMTPILLERQIRKLAEAAESLVKNLPPMEMKPLLNGHKKRTNKDLESIMTMSEDDPRRMEEIRKYAAIYGRFDCKRKPEKPLTLHEVSVNEAAAQICSKIPALLYRRDELFPLARQVVRDSGYQYSKGHSRSQSCSKLFEEHNNGEHHPNVKRMRTDTSPNNESKNKINENERKRRQDRLEGIVDQLKSLGNKQEEIKSQIQEANEQKNFQAVTELQNELELIADHQMQLVNEKAELEKQQRRLEKAKLDGDKVDHDDTDSQFSLYSNESTPSLLQDSHQNSPTSLAGTTTTTTATTSTEEAAYSKPLQASKKKNSATTSGGGGGGSSSNNIATAVANGNSNDSVDFSSKQLLNDLALDEGLRIAKEIGQALDENIDLRMFKYGNDVFRNSNNFSGLNETASGGQSQQGQSGKQYKEGGVGHRSRGRPPKVAAERELQSTFYEQILSQAQIQQQIMANYQMQVQAALAFGEFNLTVGTSNQSGASSNCAFPEQATIADKESGQLDENNFEVSQLNESTTLAKHFENLSSDKKHTDEMPVVDKDEVAQSLNALISLANNNNNDNDTLKQELGTALSSVEFKIG